MLYSTKRKLPRKRLTTRLILHRANAHNQNIQALAAKEGCGSLSRTFQMFQEGVAEFAVIPRTARAGRPQKRRRDDHRRHRHCRQLACTAAEGRSAHWRDSV